MQLIATTLTLMMAASSGLNQDRGTLDRMREDVRNDKPDKSDDDRRRRNRDDDDDDDDDSFFGALFVQVLGFGFIASAERASVGERAFGLEPRKPGEALIPTVRADVTGAWFDGGIQAYSLLSEAGWGPFAVQGTYTTLRESDPDDELDIGSLLVSLRMSIGSYVELDIAGGWGIFERDTGFVFALPFKVHPSPYFGFEFRPSWLFINETTFQDYRAVVVAGLPYISAQVGVQVYETASVSLVGPTVGFAGRF